jgi:hypothetical protein
MQKAMQRQSLSEIQTQTAKERQKAKPREMVIETQKLTG